VAAQPLALLVDMQKYVQEKYNIKCSRASLSRRIREMGYTRGIIRRGFRSEDQHVPSISPADMLRIMGDPSPDDDMMNLPPNAKRARYAWLLDGEKPEKKVKKARKKETGTSQAEAEAEAETLAIGPVDPALMQAPVEQQPQSQNPRQTVQSNGYAPVYTSPFRQVTASGGLIISPHPMDNRNVGQHMSTEDSMSMSMPRHL
jgi:hypothetical protein